MDDRTPRYRISAVAELSGVAAATIRAWERRYGIPAPSRTGSSYRLFSDHDVELVRQLKLHTENGLAPQQAAALVKAGEREVDVALPATELPGVWQGASERIVEAVRAFDRRALAEAVSRTMLLGPALRVFEDVFVPALRQVGEDWHEGRISVAQEHLASEAIGSAARAVLQLVMPTAPARHALLACFDGEHHVIASYGGAFRLASWGFGVTLLGGSLPAEALAQAVTELSPDLVALSLTTAPPTPLAESLVAAYAGACGDTPWVAGGAGAVLLAGTIEAAGGIVYGGDAERTRGLVEQRLRVS